MKKMILMTAVLLSGVCPVLSVKGAETLQFSFGNVTLDCPKPGDWKITMIREVAADGSEVAKITLDASKEALPPAFTVEFTTPQIGMDYRWRVNGHDMELPPNWASQTHSEFAVGMPLYVFFDGNDTSSLAVAASECDRRVVFNGGLIEEGSLIWCRFGYFTTPEAPMKQYTTSIRFDSKRRPFADAVRQGAAWIETAGGYKPCTPPAAAFEPLYSSWYNFHQNVFAKDIEAECEIAAKLGMKTIILDDGWQTDDTNRGYAFCGDWKVSKRRFPDMRAHVEKVQSMGIKYMVWYSVPFVGTKSANYERFKGKYLMHSLGAGVLDPRFPEVRKFLIDTYVQAMKAWGLDGFKLDFIDSFRFNGEDPAVKENYAGRDMKSLPMAVNRLMREVREALTTINPDVLLEFRQQYVGPGIRQCGNMLRAGDCPGSMRRNRCAIANLRLASGNSAIHSDMLEWNFAETPERAALYIINSMFGVVQYSVMLRDAPESHRAMIKKWLDFSLKHRDTLLKGKFTPHHPELLYPVIEAESDKERVIGVYDDGRIVDVKDGKPTFIMNATGRDTLVIRKDGAIKEAACKSGDWIEL